MDRQLYTHNTNTKGEMPAFLFGSSFEKSNILSDDGARSFESGSLENPYISKSKNVHWSPMLTQKSSTPRMHNSFHGDVHGDIPRGPPRRLLKDQREVFGLSSTEFDHPASEMSSPASPYLSHEADFSYDGSIADHCVTVFGFGREDISFVLELFSRHGTIVAHRFPSRGNWVHLRYACAVHARQALARNGRVVDGRLRLGVIPVDEEEISLLEGPVWFAAKSKKPRDVSVVNHSQDLEDENTSVVPLRRSMGPSSSGFIPLRAMSDSYENSLRVKDIGDENAMESFGFLEKLWSYFY